MASPKSPRRTSFVQQIRAAGFDDTIERRLRHYACADAYHDFDPHFNVSKKCDISNPGLCDVRKGLPDKGAEDEPETRLSGNKSAAPHKELHTENELLIEIFKDVPNIVNSDIDNNIIRGIVDECIKNTGPAVDKDKKYTIPDVDLRGIDVFNSTEQNHRYNILLFNRQKPGFSDETDVRALDISDAFTVEDVVRFFGGRSIAHFLFDASSINVIDFLKKAGGEGEFKIARLINRELINDPAPKTYNDAQGTFGNVRYDIYIEKQPEVITYRGYTSDTGAHPDAFGRGYFHSIYNFKFDQLNFKDDINEEGDVGNIIRALPTTKLDIDEDGGMRIFQTSDPHEDNCIESVQARIDEIFRGPSAKHKLAAAQYQCKRSGDWLQALSCLDRSRNYSYYDGTKYQETSVTKDPIILVTHDRVLLAYALLIGIDVLFTYIYDKGAAEQAAASAGAASTDSNRNKYLLYFRNSKFDDKTIIAGNMVDTIETAMDLCEDSEKVAEVFSTDEKIKDWCIKIYSANQQEIESNYATAMGNVNKITNLIRSYIKYANVDYGLSTYGETFKSVINQNMINLFSKFTDEDLQTLAAFDKKIALYRRTRPSANDETILEQTLTKDEIDIYKTAKSKLEFITIFNDAKVKLAGPDRDSFDATRLKKVCAMALRVIGIFKETQKLNSMFKDIGDLIAANSSYLKSPIYMNVSPLNSKIRRQRIRGAVGLVAKEEGLSENERNIIDLVNFLSTRLENERYKELLKQLEDIKNEHSADLDGTLFQMFNNLIRTTAPTKVLAVPVEPEVAREITHKCIEEAFEIVGTYKRTIAELQEARSEADKEKNINRSGVVAEKKVISTEKYGLEDEDNEEDEDIAIQDTVLQDTGDEACTSKLVEAAEGEAASARAAADSAAKAANAAAGVKEKEAAEKEAQEKLALFDAAVIKAQDAEDSFKAKQIADVEAIPPNKSRRIKLANPFKSIGVVTRNMAQKVMNYITRRKRGTAGGGASMEDYFKLLVIVYIRQVRRTLASIEGYGDFDYEYYEAHAHVVDTVLAEYSASSNYFQNLASFFYNDLHNADLSELFGGESVYANRVRIAMKSVTLASIGYGSGEIPTTGYTSEINLTSMMPSIVAKYAELQTKPFNERKLGLQMDMAEAILKLADIDTTPGAAPAAATTAVGVATTTTTSQPPIFTKVNTSRRANGKVANTQFNLNTGLAEQASLLDYYKQQQKAQQRPKKLVPAKMRTGLVPGEEPAMTLENARVAQAAFGGTRKRRIGGSRAAAAVIKGRYRRSIKRSTRKLKKGRK